MVREDQRVDGPYPGAPFGPFGALLDGPLAPLLLAGVLTFPGHLDLKEVPAPAGGGRQEEPGLVLALQTEGDVLRFLMVAVVLLVVLVAVYLRFRLGRPAPTSAGKRTKRAS